MRRAADVEAARASANPRLGFFAAQFYARAGDTDRALEWLERVLDSGEAGGPYLSCAPTWDGLRAEPRFQSLLRRMNLPS
jgi:hypothetical protein